MKKAGPSSEYIITYHMNDHMHAVSMKDWHVIVQLPDAKMKFYSQRKCRLIALWLKQPQTARHYLKPVS